MNEIISLIKEMYIAGKTLVIGIDGLGGAGKSTISEKLKTALEEDGFNVTVLHIDDFIHKKEIRYNDNYAPWECYYNLQWRYDYFTKEIIMPIKNGGDFDKKIELYDKDNDTYFLEETNIPAGSIVVTEGIFLQRQELAGLFDLMVYIDIPEQTRLERVLERDGYIGSKEDIRKKYDERYFPAERYYTEKCDPVHKADHVIR